MLAWLPLTHRRDEAAAERAARRALAGGGPGDTRLASAALAEVLLRRGDTDQAVDVLGPPTRGSRTSSGTSSRSPTRSSRAAA